MLFRSAHPGFAATIDGASAPLETVDLALLGVRVALLFAVGLGSGWLVWQKLPERYPQWTKLMTAVAPLYRPSMLVYMPPGSTMGSPRIVALQEKLPEDLADVRPVDANTHAAFLDELEHGREFVFLVYGQITNDEVTPNFGGGRGRD